MNRYRVFLSVKGGLTRPHYDGYVDVTADDTDSAGKKAVRRLISTTFRDVWPSSFVIRRVELR